jgi:hypothetical protein
MAKTTDARSALTLAREDAQSVQHAYNIRSDEADRLRTRVRELEDRCGRYERVIDALAR